MPQITEAALFEAFGLSEKMQGVADPAASGQPEENAQGGNVQEVADPAAEESNVGAGVGTEPDAGNADPEETGIDAVEDPENHKDKQTPEQRRANAARRRQQEMQVAVDNAVAAERQRMQAENAAKLNDIFARAGLVDGETGKPITTVEEFEGWYKSFADAKLQKDLKAGNLSIDVLEQIIGNHPAVKKAEQIVSQMQAVQQQQQQAADKERIDGQLAKIAELNPQIKGLGDILQMPTAAQFRDNVAKGMDFYDAYRLANMDQIAEDKAQRARQAAQANARGKEHLVPAGSSRGSGAASVPPEQMRIYRMMNPKASEAEIQAHYNQYLKEQGG